MARLEHVNLTVKDPDATARMLCDLFDWKVRWSGTAIHGGRTVHVGDDDSYLAVYTGPGGNQQDSADNSYTQLAGLNHVGVIVDNLDATEDKVRALGFEPYSHADYEPGKRFYFRDGDGVEFEVINYA